MKIIRHDSPSIFGKLRQGDLFLLEGVVMLKLCILRPEIEYNAVNICSGYPYYISYGAEVQPVDAQIEIRNKGGFDNE